MQKLPSFFSLFFHYVHKLFIFAPEKPNNLMCSYNITLNDTLVEKVRPSFADDNALQHWLQQQMEEVLLDYYVSHLEAQSTTPPPCQYTEEDVVQRVLQATADVDAGRGLMTLDEFEKFVETW